MTGSTWPEKKGYKIIIWEEIHDGFPYGLKELEEIYRRLKQSYQKYGDSDTAGKFYYQEMECKRKQMNFLKRNSWKVGLKWSCSYGEEPFRVVGVSLIIIVVFAFSYLFGGIEYLGSELASKPEKLIAYDLNLNSYGFQMLIQNFHSILKDFLFCVYTSVITFTTMGYGDVHPIGLSRVFASIESGLGVFMTALLIFVFTRKMLR